MLNLFNEYPNMPVSQKIVFILSMFTTAGAFVFLTLDWAKMMKNADYFFIPCIGLDIILSGILSLMRKQKGLGIFYLILGLFVMSIYAIHLLQSV